MKTHLRQIALALLICSVVHSKLTAEVVVLVNQTEQPVAFSYQGVAAANGQTTAIEQQIPSSDFAIVHHIGRLTIRYSDGRKLLTHRLDANCAYQFLSKSPNQIELEKIFLAGDGRTLGGTGIAKPINLLRSKTIPVKIYVDDNQRSATALWQRQLSKRLEEASAIFSQHCLLDFRLAGFGEWDSDDKINDFAVSLAEFEREVPDVPGGFVIGFTSQYSVATGTNKLGGTRGPLHPHILISEQSTVISEGERLEVLVHELGHCLGAAHSIDPHSVMRPLLGDRLARAADFRIKFDPANTIALNLISEELRIRNASRRTQMRPETGLRLTQIHQELERRLHRRRLEELARRQKMQQKNKPPANRVAKNGKQPNNDKPNAKPADPVTASAKQKELAAGALFNLVLNKDLASPELRKGTRAILNDLVKAAETNAALPLPQKPAETDPYEGVLFSESPGVNQPTASLRLAQQPNAKRNRLTGDRLTAFYVRVAAASAGRLPGKHSNSAFLLALGIAIDSSDILHRVPQTGEFCRAVESTTQRQRRLQSLGQPTVLGRRDLAQHFVVSAHLTVALGRATAEAAGVAKEIIDAERGTGFSFADLAANKAGIRMATYLDRGEISLKQVAQTFRVADFVPAIDGLPEQLGSTTFKNEYGNGSGEKFAKTIREIDSRLKNLAAYK